MIGYQDLLVILGIGVFVFGAKKLPELASSLGKSMKEFKKAVSGGADEEGDPRPQATLAASTAAARLCGVCQIPLAADWTHCPRCGAPASQK